MTEEFVMLNFLSNIWVKRTIAVFNIMYVGIITMLTYATFLYTLEINEGTEGTFYGIYIAASALFLLLMIYSREQKVTCIMAMILLPVVFCLLLFNMGNWLLIVPPFIVALVAFFVCGVGDTAKVIMGTIYLLLYVLGIVAYIVMNMLMTGNSTETLIDINLEPGTEVYDLYKSSAEKINIMTDYKNTVSPDGKYRFYIADVQNSFKGSVNIYVVPYGQDKDLKFFKLRQKGIKKTISSQGKRGIIPDVGWLDETHIFYRLVDGGDEHVSEVNDSVMPKKQYLGFLGLT